MEFSWLASSTSLQEEKIERTQVPQADVDGQTLENGSVQVRETTHSHAALDKLVVRDTVLLPDRLSEFPHRRTEEFSVV
jgi:hypothetical protein